MSLQARHVLGWFLQLPPSKDAYAYATEAKLQIHNDLKTEEFIRRQVTVGAYRRGIVCEIADKGIDRAVYVRYFGLLPKRRSVP